ADARDWGQRIGVENPQELIALLNRAPLTAREEKEAVKRWSSRYGLRLQETAGLDAAYDGEQQRSEMYAWAVAHTNGFDWRGSVWGIDNKHWQKAARIWPNLLQRPLRPDTSAIMP